MNWTSLWNLMRPFGSEPKDVDMAYSLGVRRGYERAKEQFELMAIDMNKKIDVVIRSVELKIPLDIKVIEQNKVMSRDFATGEPCLVGDIVTIPNYCVNVLIEPKHRTLFLKTYSDFNFKQTKEK